MKLVVDPPQEITGVSLRMVSVVKIAVRHVPVGIVGSGEKVPVAILIGTGRTARLVGLDGMMMVPSDIGLEERYMTGH